MAFDFDSDEDVELKVLHVIDIQSGDFLQLCASSWRVKSLRLLLTAMRSTSLASLLDRSWCSSSLGPRRKGR